MGRRGDCTGVKQTCPSIDAVRDFIEGIEWSDDENSLEKQAKEACLTLEEIRIMNQELREFGNMHYHRADEAEEDRDYYKRQVETLEDEVKDLKNDIKGLEKEINLSNS